MILFNNEIKKSDVPYSITIKNLRKFLDKKEPKLTYLFARFTNTLQNSITYPQLRQALLRGGMDNATFDQWTEEYSKFVVDDLYPEWKEAMDTSAQALRDKYPTYLFDPNTPAVRQWATERAAELIVSITAQQRASVNVMMQRAAVIQDVSVDQFAMIIRPIIGLYPRQATANLNYFEHVKNTLLESNKHMKVETATKRATEASIKYSERQNRYRASMVARTELCASFNYGEFHAVKQAQEQGLMGHSVKEWVTAGDERVCPVCKALDGTQIEMDGDWEMKTNWDKKAPPAHPHCRCVLVYRELSPPVITAEEG